MAVSINGSGLVSGVNTAAFITANTVTTNLLNDGAVTIDKLGTTSKVFKFTQLTYNTRTSWSNYADYIFWSQYYTKERADSKLFIQLNLATFGTYSYCYTFYARYAGGSYFQGTMSNIASSVGYSMRQTSEFILTNATNTGSNLIDIKWNCVNNDAGNKPALIWNPNASDEARLTQQYSSMNIWEYI